jgi:PAS domain S-box-containing protein
VPVDSRNTPGLIPADGCEAARIEALIRRNQELEALRAIVAAVTTIPSLPEALDAALQQVLAAMDLPAGIVQLLKPSTGELSIAAHAGLSPKLLADLTAQDGVGKAPASAAIEGRRVVVLGDLPDGSHSAYPWALHGFRTFVSAPLECKGTLLGTVSLVSREPRSLSTEAQGLLTTLLATIAMAVANAERDAGARLLEQEQEARAQAEAAQAKLRDLLELAPDAILVVGGDGRITLLNTQAERMFGYQREELVGETIEALLPERFRAGHAVHRDGYRAEPRTRPMGTGLDLYARRKDGSEFPVEISLGPSRADSEFSVIAVIRDITDRRQASLERDRLLASEREKAEQLKLAVREAHHRIKNNLQAISDLLYLELASNSDAASSDILQESVERIQSIALVHDLLSQDEDVQTVDTRAMAERLIPMVLRSGNHSPNALELTVSVPSISVSSKKATTLALILNELVSNAVKHALGGSASPELSVRLAPENEGLMLRVQDNGPGLREGFDLQRDANVGLQVVRTLAERDLGGKLTLSRGPRLTAAVWFPW